MIQYSQKSEDWIVPEIQLYSYGYILIKLFRDSSWTSRYLICSPGVVWFSKRNTSILESQTTLSLGNKQGPVSLPSNSLTYLRNFPGAAVSIISVFNRCFHVNISGSLERCL